MAQFKNNRFAKSPSSRPPFRGSGRPEGKELHNATCNKCQKQCQVPFRPNGKKPIYCSDCFIGNEGGDSSYRPNDRGGDRGDFRGEKRPFTSRRPEGDFNASSRDADRKIDELTKKVDSMVAILDTLVTTIDTFNRATALTKEIRKHFPEEKPVKVEKTAKPAAKKAVVAKKPAKAPAKATKK